MRAKTFAALAFFGSAALAPLVRPAGTASAGDGPDAAAVTKAIDRGVQTLRQRFAAGFEDVSFHNEGELVLLAMSHAGVNLTDPLFAKGVKFLEKVEPRWTYRTALLAMALNEVNPRLYQSRIAWCAQWLVDNQLAGGEWGYPGAPEGSYLKADGVKGKPPPKAEGDESKPDAPKAKVTIVRQVPVKEHGASKGDFSNTQVAILGLRAAREAGVEVPKETWKAAQDYLRGTQHKDGGWGYVVGGQQDDTSYSSLTCAAVCSAAICADALGNKAPKGDPIVAKGLGWIAKHLDLSKNVGVADSSVAGPSPWQYYHLYSVERAARVLGLKELASVAWYEKGAAWLLEHQQADGAWADEPGMGPQPDYLHVADTSFALLFLTRSTRPLTGP